MNDQNLVGQGGDEFIPLTRGFDRWSPRLFLEGRQNQQAIGCKSGTPIGWEPDFFHRAGEANDDGLLAAQKNAKAILFNWRVKAADDRYSMVAKLPSDVVGAQDDISWNASGAK
jgi:hypothetical protein